MAGRGCPWRASDKTIYKQLGNAVNVGVVQSVATALFESAGFTIAEAGDIAIAG